MSVLLYLVLLEYCIAHNIIIRAAVSTLVPNMNKK